MSQEIETKFKIKDPDEFRQKLSETNATFIGKSLEQDTFYSFKGADATIEGIRLRVIDKGKGLFTIKKHLHDKDAAVYKVREETEVFVDDASRFDTMLRQIGFVPLMRKEKIRETYKLSGVTVVLDQLPFIGCYVEIESSKDDICKTAACLGLDMSKAIPDSYLKLFQIYKMAKGKPRLEMIFENNVV